MHFLPKLPALTTILNYTGLRFISSAYQEFDNTEVCTLNENKTVVIGLVKLKLTESRERVFAAAVRITTAHLRIIKAVRAGRVFRIIRVVKPIIFVTFIRVIELVRVFEINEKMNVLIDSIGTEDCVHDGGDPPQ